MTRSKANKYQHEGDVQASKSSWDPLGFGGGISLLNAVQMRKNIGLTGKSILQRLEGKRNVQRKADNNAQVKAAAAYGVEGSSGAIPHQEAIQRSFGRHDVGGIESHQGSKAGEACSAMGAEAYAQGNHVVFGRSPSLHTAAHEATHVIQQKAGVQLSGGIGQVGDVYERHADAVADKVVSGGSAETLLSQFTGSAGGSSAVQREEEEGEESKKIGPDLDEAEKIVAVAEAMEAKAVEYESMGGSCAEANTIAARLLREKKAEWYAALGGEGQWENIAYDATREDVEGALSTILMFDIENKVWHEIHARYSAEVRGASNILGKKRAALEEIMKASDEAEAFMLEIKFGVEFMGYMELLQSVGEIAAIGPTRAANMPDVVTNGGTIVNGPAGATGADLIDDMISSGLVQKLSQRKLVNTCLNDSDRDVRECAQLDVDPERLLQEMAVLSTKIETMGYKLMMMNEHGDWNEGRVLGCE